jgi:hypothetical protein
MPDPRSEFDFETVEAALTTRQRADFTVDRSALVDDWLSGKLPLDQAAAAMRARIQKLPASRRALRADGLSAGSGDTSDKPVN